MAEGFRGRDGADLFIQLCSSPMGHGLTLLPNAQAPLQMGPNQCPGISLGARGGQHGNPLAGALLTRLSAISGRRQRKQGSRGVREGEPSQGQQGGPECLGQDLAQDTQVFQTYCPEGLALPPSLGTILHSPTGGKQGRLGRLTALGLSSYCSSLVPGIRCQGGTDMYPHCKEKGGDWDNTGEQKTVPKGDWAGPSVSVPV